MSGSDGRSAPAIGKQPVQKTGEFGWIKPLKQIIDRSLLSILSTGLAHLILMYSESSQLFCEFSTPGFEATRYLWQ